MSQVTHTSTSRKTNTYSEQKQAFDTDHKQFFALIYLTKININYEKFLIYLKYV